VGCQVDFDKELIDANNWVDLGDVLALIFHKRSLGIALQVNLGVNNPVAV
jgi:hypothetical protein